MTVNVTSGIVAALVAVACSATRDNVPILTGPELPGARQVWVVGVANNAKLGAVVVAGRHTLHCEGRVGWPLELAGKPIVVAGTLRSRFVPPPPVGPGGERSAGAEGTMWTISECVSPPPHAGNSLLDAERALFAALAQRDRGQLERLIAPELVLRVPGQPDVDRAALLDSISTTPGGILEITGDKLRSYDAGDAGIVEGIQVARVRIDGKVIEDRGAFVDVFAKRDGAWRLTFALNVSLTDPAAP